MYRLEQECVNTNITLRAILKGSLYFNPWKRFQFILKLSLLTEALSKAENKPKVYF